MKDIQTEILNKIKKAKTIALFTHINPDGDAYGSMCSLFYALSKLGKKVSMFSEEKIDAKYQEFVPMEKISNEEVTADFELVISLDTATLERLGKYTVFFGKHQNSIKIDHHFVRENYGNLSLVLPEFGSCAEIVYDLLIKLKVEIDKKIATLLYMGITTDIGAFMYDNTRPESLEICANLLRCGANATLVNYNMFQFIPKRKIELIKFLYEEMELYKNGLGIVLSTKKDYAKTGTTKTDVGEFYNVLINIEGIFLAIQANEKSTNEFSVSFRCRGKLDVRILAGEFGGGGHKRASGAIIKGNSTQVKEKLIKKANEFLEKYKEDLC